MAKPSIIQSTIGAIPYGINFLLYGDPGCGKTPLIAEEGVLILDADHGAESAAGSGADFWTVNSWIDMDEAYEYLRHDPNHGYRWVWLDGISVGQDRLLTGIMEDLVEEKQHRKVWQIDKGEYGQNMQRLKQWVQHMTALPFNFGITSHPWRFSDQVTDEERIMPWIQGKNMAPTISGMMNVIGYLVEIGGERRLYTKPHNNYYARDKFRALGPGMVNPTLTKIEAKILNKVKEEAKKKIKSVPATRLVAKKATPRRRVS